MPYRGQSVLRSQLKLQTTSLRPTPIRNTVIIHSTIQDGELVIFTSWSSEI